MQSSASDEKQIHPIVRLNYVVRLVACPFVLLIVAASRLGTEEGMPPALWALFGAYALLWPHVAYRLSRRSVDIRAWEVRFLLVDSAVAGVAIALGSFRPVPTLVIVTAILTILGSVGGPLLLAAGFGTLAATTLLTGALVTDFAVATNTPLVVELLSAGTLLVFQTMMGLLTWRTARNFVAIRKRIAEQADEILRQNDQLREAREEALQAARAKAAFLATMSHEIRTPLNGVLGMTRLLAETPLSPEQLDLLRTAQVSGQQLLSVINDVLDYSRIESGRLELEREPLRLGEVVEEALEIVSERAHERGLELICDLSPDVPHAILGDVTRLRQVVTNLVGNAVKFTEQGEIVVRVYLARPETDEAPAVIGFDVSDTGIGIPEDRIPILFTPFSQADASTTRKYGGTGLGLAISRRLTRLMGGEMSVESRVGRGTTVTFTIEGRAAAMGPSFHGDSAHLSTGRVVLIVDDNATNLRVLSAQLENWGFDHRSAEHAAGAAELARTMRFDLAILDLHMPLVDGMSLAKELRSIAPRMPMVLLSSSLVLAKDDPDHLFAARLLKPARQSSLFDSIVGALEGRQSRSHSMQSEPGLHSIAGIAPLSILVADDNEINRQVANLVLRRLGYEPDFAQNGNEVVDKVAAAAMAPDKGDGPYDLVFMDIHMPEMDGLEATRAIRQLAEELPEAHWPRIVAMTADAMHDDRQICLDAGMDDYLTKPLDFDAVGRVLRQTAKAMGIGPLVVEESPAVSIPAAQASETPLVDLSRLEELRAYDTPDGAIVRGAIAAFSGQAPALLAAIRAGVETRDGDSLRESAHRLKGSAANVGAAAACAGAIERAARDGALDRAASLIDELDATLARTVAALDGDTTPAV
jgi:signal transduction histidine kinase/CheY-like chemotaxis protein